MGGSGPVQNLFQFQSEEYDLLIFIKDLISSLSESLLALPRSLLYGVGYSNNLLQKFLRYFSLILVFTKDVWFIGHPCLL